jgi:SAM-dependent methyltransferase
MRRIQFIELHDQPWFPSFLRDEVTDALQYGLTLFTLYEPIAPILQSLLEKTAATRIVDLCSGGGGPLLELSRAIPLDGKLQILLTDKYPNRRAFDRIRTASMQRVEFRSEPVDAMHVPRDLTGVRTIFTSFHHFPPEQAAALLRDAMEARQPIGIFEITARALSAVAWIPAWALFAFLCAPLIRPFRWSRLLWTDVIPVVPVVLLFDGIVSCLRSYRPNELLDIAGKLKGNEYAWKAGEIAAKAGGKITYLIGSPQLAADRGGEDSRRPSPAHG